ncbi:Hypothetical predicted protein [Octopus vulgaris]|uniref:Uncharacterized protein n=1 Tax=Octopus vulgaris TaxID=6645 RepID=A0AA36BZ94_OCTVU|nr:Hypothetical predicted protein [Octopus vulgaris]
MNVGQVWPGTKPKEMLPCGSQSLNTNNNNNKNNRINKTNAASLQPTTADLADIHKIINHLTNNNSEHLFKLHLSNTYGHIYKVRKQHSSHDFRKHFFTLRVAEAWNKLPASVVSCRSTASFKTS